MSVKVKMSDSLASAIQQSLGHMVTYWQEQQGKPAAESGKRLFAEALESWEKARDEFDAACESSQEDE